MNIEKQIFAWTILPPVAGQCCAGRQAGIFSFSPRDFYAKPALASGSSRWRFPVAAKIALHNAGVNGGTPGSPIPAGGASLSTRWTCV